ncbi:complex I subunit 5 family protein [Caldilinea sp.]|jgi:formate hydrogenlyase subunit 3/multisubunit Na+/H+ antiporter MnhD subunit|uniref:complex I subunit 5 family protein n=1 Tax=Caldilinea sp. TaxID=2293560 RepID=UPI0021DBF15D|nr:proton-conducting transporter membrane subunit [Caldilinea sp.]GIV68939.1 MAG: NADH dehydrogenase [Caldilinea sp.]
MIFEAAFWLPVAIMAPLLAALCAFLAPPRMSPLVTMIGAAITFVAVGFLSALLVRDGPTRHPVGGWGAPLGIDLAADGLSALMLMLTAVVGAAVALYAYGYFNFPGHNEETKQRYASFWPLWLFLWSALNALFLSRDVFNLYVTLELVSFAAVALTALAGKPDVLRAAMRYLLVSLAGSLFYLMGVAFLYGEFGVLDIDQLKKGVTTAPSLAAAAGLMTVGLMMKTALFPLHFWLPPAHANAIAPVSALLSGLVVKGSFYILLRAWLEIFYPLSHTGAPSLLMGLGGVAILWGSLQAIRQTRLKLLIAYSTVAQIGYLFLLMPLLFVKEQSALALTGIVCFILAHASAKAAAFLSAGAIQLVTGDDRIASLRGLMEMQPLAVVAFGAAGVSLAALPPSGGFIAKWFMLDASLAHGDWLIAAIIVAGGLLAAIYVMRVVAPLFRQPDDAVLHRLTLAPKTMTLSAFSLAVLALLLSFAGIAVMEMLSIGAIGMLGIE